MPGETTNIAEMAEIAANDIFSFFGWKMRGPTNENFPCVKIKEHQKSSHPHHPSDAVYAYDEPYKNITTYVLTDFKSYAKGSLSKASMSGALRELAKAVDCAYVESTFSERHINTNENHEINGMLFVYNHDGEFDSDFDKLFIDFGPDSLTVPRRSKIFVLGPDRIEYLTSIITDAKLLIADDRLSKNSDEKFLYPDQILNIARKQKAPIATLEYILGPILILPHNTSTNSGFFIYYDGEGNSDSEFEILFDYFFRNQLVQVGVSIEIRMLNACSTFRTNFENAQTNFLNSLWGLNEIEDRLKQITVSKINKTVTKFNSVEIGMDRRKI